MDEVKEYLEDFGIHLGLIIAGLFGAYLSVSINKELTVLQKITVIISGAATANYVAPFIFQYLNVGDNAQFGLAFLIGFSGLKGVEWIIVTIKNKYGKQKADS